MDELISRQMAIDALEKDKTVLSQIISGMSENDAQLEHYVAQRNQVVYDIDAIEQLPPAQPEPRWIPVSKPPKKNGRYLVTRGMNACGSLWNRVYIINYSDLMGLCKEKIWWTGNVGKSDFVRIEDVLAWMPLPTAYERSEDEIQQ